MYALVIGANSAVAKAWMEQLIAANAQVRLICAVRNEVKFQTWQQAHAANIQTTIISDFSDIDRFGSQLECALADVPNVSQVLIAQGVLLDQVDSETDISLLEQMLQVNFLSVVASLMAVVKHASHTACKVAVITSVAGMRGRPRNFSYGATKSALSIYLQGLRSSLYNKPIEFYDIRLGPVISPMTTEHSKNFSFTTTDKAAKSIHKAMRGKCYTCYVPGFWRFVMLVVKWMPEWLFQKLKFLSGR